MNTTTASTTASDTGRSAAPGSARRRFTRISRAAAVVTALVALVTLGTVALEAAPAGAAVPEGHYSPTAIRCWNPYGQMDLNLGISGAYDNQWVAVRHYYYVYNMDAGRWESDVSAREYRQVAGPNTAVIGGTQSINGANFVAFEKPQP